VSGTLGSQRREHSLTNEREIDAITFSVLLSRFNSIAYEMTLTLEKTAYSSILSLGRDYSCGIYDAVPRQVCMFEAIPVHTNSMHLVLREIAETFRGTVNEGDVFVCNHPYRANTHIGDLVAAVPVFVEGRHLFWAATRGHQQDVGAFIPGSMPAMARNVWQEGFLIPPLKLAEQGRLRADLVDLYLSNVRYPEMLHGDLLAELASVEKGRIRLVELAEEYSADGLMRYVDAIIDYADRRMSDCVAAIPDGEYDGESWVDSDGAGQLNIPIRARVTVAGDQVLVDFSGSGPQSPTGVNGSYATTHQAAALPFLYYLDADIPKNHGCLQHIDAYAPEGTICNARYPASTAMATATPPNAMYDAINKALAFAIPDLVFGGGARCNNFPEFAGTDPRTGRDWATMLFNPGGGQGAAKGADGWPLCGSQSAMGGLKTLSIEQIELLYPLFVESWEIETDSMGFGTWIGGPGNRMLVRPIGAAIECCSVADGYDNPPHGIVYGTRGSGGGQYVENQSTGKRRFMSAVGFFRIETNEVWVGVSTGGGGYGNPLERDPEQVRRDVRDGFVSGESAREVFGVALSGDWDPVLDREATEKLRAPLRSVCRPCVDPLEPGAATWTAETMREQDEYVLNPLESAVFS
jgi:N-methylhydantoinase B